MGTWIARAQIANVVGSHNRRKDVHAFAQKTSRTTRPRTDGVEVHSRDDGDESDRNARRATQRGAAYKNSQHCPDSNR